MAAVGDMLVKLSSLVGGNPQWSSQDPLNVSFKKVSAEETAEALWNKVSLARRNLLALAQ